MTRLLIATLLISFFSSANGQSFEGTLTYQVEFEVKTRKIGDFEVTREMIVQKMKSEGEYFDEAVISIKGGNYVKTDNSSLERRAIYKADVNKIYILEKDFEYVIISDANKTRLMKLTMPEPTYEKMDSTKVIDGKECTLLQLTWENIGTELYFYNSESLKIDPSLFENHNYEYLNEVLKITRAYPMEVVKKINDFVTIRMTLVNVDEGNVDESLFELPEMTEAEEDYADMMMNMTGAEVKKIKN